MKKSDYEELYEKFEFLRLTMLLRPVLTGRGKMAMELFEFEFKDKDLDEFKQILENDEAEYLFAITENSSDIAMVLVESSGEVYKNEEAKKRLRKLWKKSYGDIIRKMIRFFAEQLAEGALAITIVKTIGGIPVARISNFVIPILV